MELEIANNILGAYNLPPIQNLKKVEVGFTNTVYELDNKYILKVCTDDKQNEAPFRLEAQLYGYYKDKLPVPQLIAFNDEKMLIPYTFMLYPRITGDNLYNVWHLMTVEQRRNVIKQFCDMLRTVNQTELTALPPSVELKPVDSWRKIIETRLNKYLQIAEQMQTIKPETISSVKQFVEQHGSSLDEQKLALTYWDVHFDNVLVQDNQIVGLLDFERTEIASIDFVLDTAKRMVVFPKKYMSQYAEQFAKDEDYEDLLNWYKEFYPELFDFTNLERRLDLYSIAHDLEDLEGWPNVQQLKDNIKQTVNNLSES